MPKDFLAYFLDLDGTLLNSDKFGNKYITNNNLISIKKAINEGKKIIISTGRLSDFTKKFMKETNIPYAVCGNGAKVIDWQGNVLLEHIIEKESLELIKIFLKKYDLAFKVNQIRVAFNVKSDISRDIGTRLKYKLQSDSNFTLDEKPYKIIIWGKKEENLLKIIEELHKIPGINATSAERGLTIEITHSNATKGLSNKWVAKNLLNIKDIKNNCVHIGDTMNDSSVIGVFKYFIAPIDGEKKLLDISPYLCPSHKEDCIEKVLNGKWWINENIKI